MAKTDKVFLQHAIICTINLYKALVLKLKNNYIKTL